MCLSKGSPALEQCTEGVKLKERNVQQFSIICINFSYFNQRVVTLYLET